VFRFVVLFLGLREVVLGSKEANGFFRPVRESSFPDRGRWPKVCSIGRDAGRDRPPGLDPEDAKACKEPLGVIFIQGVP
jgi:hypothetical protein